MRLCGPRSESQQLLLGLCRKSEERSYNTWSRRIWWIFSKNWTSVACVTQAFPLVVLPHRLSRRLLCSNPYPVPLRKYCRNAGLREGLPCGKRRLCDSLPHYDFIMSAVTLPYWYSTSSAIRQLLHQNSCFLCVSCQRWWAVLIVDFWSCFVRLSCNAVLFRKF